MRRLVLVFCSAALGLGGVSHAQDIELESQRTRFRLTYESANVEDDDDLDLAGVHYDVLSPFEKLPNLYLGVGGYAAVGDDRGGFFLGGFTVGVLWQVFPLWFLDAGVFAGGGGGGNGPEAEGWALRPFVGLERSLGVVGLRFEVSRLDMDELEPDGVSFAFGFSFSSELLKARPGSRPNEIADDALAGDGIRVTPRWLFLDPDSDAELRNGGAANNDIGMLGIGFDYFLVDGLYVPIEAYGATSGGAGGFALAMAGLGISVPLWGDRLSLEAKATGGAGGGGDIDTGDGYGWHAQAGLRVGVWRSIDLEAMAGKLSFPDGEFDASTLSVALSWSGTPAQLALSYPRGNLAREGLSSERAELAGTRLQVLHKTYVPRSDARKTNGDDYDDTLSLLGVGIEQPITSWYSLTGRAFAAWNGDVGGYAEGLLGSKIEVVPYDWERHHFSIAAEVGAAGGGGVDVESGLVFHFSGGYHYDINESLRLSFEAGTIEANSGSFNAESYTVGLSWGLTRAYLDG